MMTNFLIALDFSPHNFASWYLLNTYLQKRANQSSHLLMPISAHEQTQMLQQQSVVDGNLKRLTSVA